MAATIVLVSWLFVSLLLPKRSFDGNVDDSRLGRRGDSHASPSATAVSVAWDDHRVEEDFFSIDTDIELTFALMNVTSDDDSSGDSGDETDEDNRFNVLIPDILT